MRLESVTETDFPPGSVIGHEVVKAAYFRDSYRAPLRLRGLDMVTIYAAMFGHLPLPVKLVLIARNAVARLCGLETSSAGEILDPRIGGAYAVGDKIGPWPIFAITADEIVAGRDNSHMDFRLSVLRTHDDTGSSVTVSTVCTVHNLYGRLYMSVIEPFHRAGVKALMTRALGAGRL